MKQKTFIFSTLNISEQGTSPFILNWAPQIM